MRVFAATGGIMALSLLFVEDKAHDSGIYELVEEELVALFRDRLGEIDCEPLADECSTEEDGCYEVVRQGAEVLDEVIEKKLT